MVDKLLPHNIDAEESLLGSILLDGLEIMRLVSPMIEPMDFYSERNRWIYEACQALYARVTPPQQITVAEELGDKLQSCGGAAYLSHLISVTPTSLDAPYYAEIVSDLSKKRKLIALSERIAQMGYNGDKPDDIVSQVDELWTGYKNTNSTTSHVITPEMAANDLIKLGAKYGEPAHFPQWGFRDLDNITAGISPEYILFGARPTVGKTQLCVDIAENVIAQDKFVMLASAEMQSEQLYERRISRTIGLSILQLRKFGMTSDQMDKLMEMAEEVAKTKLHYFTGKLAFKDIYREAYHWKEKGKLDLLIIDYIGALTDCYAENKDSQSTRVSRVSNKIQAMTHELNIPILVASQLNRELEKTTTTGFRGPVRTRKPQLSDLRDSGSLEQDPDVIFLLHRELEHPDVVGSQELSNVLQVKMAKNRQLGAANHIELAYNHNLHRYVDCTKREG